MKQNTLDKKRQEEEANMTTAMTCYKVYEMSLKKNQPESIVDSKYEAFQLAHNKLTNAQQKEFRYYLLSLLK